MTTLAKAPRRTVGHAVSTIALGIALSAAPVSITPASAEPEGPVRTLLSGSFFPFSGAFPPPSERCQKAAAKRRAQRDDNILNSQDLLRLRRIGCGGVSAW